MSEQNISRHRGDTWSQQVTVLKDGSPFDITSCTFKFTVSSEENPTALFTTERATGTLESGSDANTAKATGEFTNAVVGDLFYNVTKDACAYILTRTSADSVELDRDISTQASGNTFKTGVSSQIIQIAGSITDAPNGVVEFPFTAIDADHVGSYFYEIQMTNATGKVITLRKGRIIFLQDITK